MTKLTTTSWVKIALIGLLCLVLCTGVGGCFVGLQRWAGTVANDALQHYDAIYDASGFADAGGHEFAPADVRDISIDWLAGKADLLAVDDEACGGMIVVQETSARYGSDIPGSERLRWKLDEGHLAIAYAGGQLVNWPFGLGSCSADIQKTLTVMIPRSYAQELGVMRISAASGGYSLTGIGCERLVVDLASGELNGTALTVNACELDIASGNVDLEGAFSGRMSLDMMSGNVQVSCTEGRPSAASFSVASGTMQLHTAADDAAGYTVTLDHLSGEFSCPRAQPQGGGYVVGDGSASYVVDMASGNVLID